MGSACSRGSVPLNLPSAPAGNRGSEPGTSDSSDGTPADCDSSGGNADTAGGRSLPHLSIDVSGEDARGSKAAVASLLLSKKGLDETTTTPTADSISPASLIDGEVSPEASGIANMFKAAGGLKADVGGAKKGVSFAERVSEGDDNGGEPGPSTAASKTAALLMGKAPPGEKMKGANGAAAALLLGKPTGQTAALGIASKLRAKVEYRKLQSKNIASKFAKVSSKHEGKFTSQFKSSKRSAFNYEDPKLKNLNYGITVQYLVEFTNHHDCWDLTTRQVVDLVIKPLTEQHDYCRFLDLPFVTEFAGAASVFVVHSWAGNWGSLVAAAAQHSPPDRRVWVDVLAIRQWDTDANGKPVASTSMVIDALVPVMSSCQGVLFVMESNSSVAQLNFDNAETNNFDASNLFSPTTLSKIPFFRLWCVFEMCMAAALQLPVVMKVGFANTLGQFVSSQARDTLQNLFLLIDTEHAKTTNPEDHTAIMATMSRMPGIQGSMDNINNLIKVMVTQSLMWILEPALMAAALGNTQLLDELKLYGKVTPGQLHAAACAGLEGPLSELLAVPNIDADMRDEKGYTALMKAAVWGHLNIVKKLADAGASCVAANLDGATPLMMARAANHSALVAWLQQEGIPRHQQEAALPGLLQHNVHDSPGGVANKLKGLASQHAAVSSYI